MQKVSVESKEDVEYIRQQLNAAVGDDEEMQKVRVCQHLPGYFDHK
jgi:hypothetical protein